MKNLKHILILCTGNSCRSIIAEALINATFSDIKAQSAGVNPSGRVNPNAKRLLQENGIWNKAYHSKDISQIKGFFDFVVTVCDNAQESCPNYPNATKTIHIGFDDPDGKEYSEFEKCYNSIKDILLPKIKEEVDKNG
jgi:arsenate reductase